MDVQSEPDVFRIDRMACNDRRPRVLDAATATSSGHRAGVAAITNDNGWRGAASRQEESDSHEDAGIRNMLAH